MQYKLLKDVGRFSKGHRLVKQETDTGFDFSFPDESTFTVNFLFEHNREEYFEEVVETPKPRWKVGDYVVSITSEYIKIHKVIFYKGKYYYDNCSETCFRDPTSEELSIYFR